MTKKILALALAGTTAFSVFAGALSVNAGWAGTPYDSAYTWEVTPSTAPDAFENLNANDTPTLSATAIAAGDISKISFDSPTGDGFEYADDVYYVADWVVRDSKKTAGFKTDIETMQAPGGTPAAKNVFGIYETNDGESTPGTADNDGTAIILKNTEDKDWTAAWAKLISNYGTVKDYIDSGNVSEALVAADYDVEDFDDYDAELLFAAINTISATPSAATLSYLTYLNSEYARIMDLVGEADTSTKEENYYRRLDRVEALDEADYTVYNWRTIQAYLGNAEDKAAEGKWDDAIDYLDDALGVNPEKATYTDLRDTLLAMYDNNGKTSTSYIVPNTGSGADTTLYRNAAYAVYDVSDYVSGGSTKSAWNELFSDDFEYDLDRDGNIDSPKYKGIYGFAYEVYRQASKGVRVGQSTVDYANELLNSAIEALEPTSSSSNWSLLKLETLIEISSELDESDFNTGARAYKTFVTALERAEAVLAKASPAKSEVTKATSTLEEALEKVASVSKAVPYATRKAMTDAQKAAQKLYNEFITEKISGAQVVALKTALDRYADGSYQTSFDIEGGAPIKPLISDVEAMTEEFNAAIEGFNQTQGWYEENGAWKYGEGDSVLNNGWNKIGNFWFFFNEDGTAKESEWFQDGGKWYYAGNTCVAYSGWGMVDGSWYYFGKDCAMATGWIRPANSYYYLDPTSGKMVTGWAQIGGKWYYFSTDANTLGAMLTSTTTPDGYEVGADGAMI